MDFKIKYLLDGYIVILVLTMLWQTFKPLPKNINYKSKKYIIGENDIKFFNDLTVGDNVEQQIFDRILNLIDKARKYILIDIFLFNSFNVQTDKIHSKIYEKISYKLINKIKKYPNIKIDIVTDSINLVYYGGENKELEKLKNAGVNVIITDLKKLRDSNPLYSSIWRSLFQWFGNSNKLGFFPHPFSSRAEKVSLRTYLYLLNFKANHRKVIVADRGDQMVSIITSANIHNASSTHSNVAVEIIGEFWKNIYISENAVARLSGKKLSNQVLPGIKNGENSENVVEVFLITERKIREQLVGLIQCAQKNELIRIGVFYLSSRIIIKELIKASKRGVNIKIILDPNKDAFGYRKNGIPNRQVARELINKTNGNIKIRWYNTTGEQFHSKFIILNKCNKKVMCLLGSANFTRRNLENYNLETDVMVVGKNEIDFFQSIDRYFEKIWYNKNNKKYTLNYDIYKDKSLIKQFVYRIQEFFGISGF